MRPHRTHAAPRRPSWRAAIIPSAALALAGAWISGCSVLYDLNTEQCSTDADCDALGGDFRGLACVQHLCQTPPGCNSNAECIDQLGNGNEAYACIERDCVPLRTAECPEVLPKGNELWLENLRTTNPIILAGTGILSGGNNFDALLRNYDLALTELTTKVGGIGSPSRRFVMLGCKANVASREELDRMMTHISQTVKVPGFVSALFADDLRYAYEAYGQPASMFFMSPLESDPGLAVLGDSGRLWHIGPRPEVIARAYAPLLTRTLAHLQVTGTVRVATVLANDQPFLANMMTTVNSAPADFGLEFNGQSVVENLQNATPTYLGLTVSSGAATAAQVQQLLAFKPHVIISVAGREFFDTIINGVELGWNAGDGPKPFYLLSPFNYNDRDALNAVTETNATLRSRLAGVNGAAAEDPTVYNRYFTAYQTAYQLNDTGYENFYDAAYYLMYSAAAVVGESSLETGEDFPRGMRRLLNGPEFDVGFDQIPTALQALAVGGASITLNGTLGPPNWNDNGTRNLPGSVYCIDGTNNYVPDVLRYREATADDASTVSLTGTFTCIPGF